MKNRVVRLTESDLEKLVKRIIKESDPEFNPEMMGTEENPEDEKVTSSELKTLQGQSRKSTGGMTPREKTVSSRLVKLMQDFGKRNGEQMIGPIPNLFQRFIDVYNKKYGTKI